MNKRIIPSLIGIFFIGVLTFFLYTKFLDAGLRKPEPTGNMAKYNLKYDNLVEKGRHDILPYFESSNEDYEIFYIGHAESRICKEYTPLISDVMHSKEKNIIYTDTEYLRKTWIEDGVPKNNPIYNALIYDIMRLSGLTEEKCLSKGWINETEFKVGDFINGEKVTQEATLLQIFVPKYFLVKKGKIVGCFTYETLGKIDNDSTKLDAATKKERDAQITIGFKKWLEERI